MISAEKMNANFKAVKTATDALEAKTTMLETAKVTGLRFGSFNEPCTIIDNPLTNGNPNLILSVSVSRLSANAVLAAGPIYVNGKWNVCTLNNATPTSQTEYHVMVIKP